MDAAISSDTDDFFFSVQVCEVIALISPEIRGSQGFYRSALGSGALTAAKVCTDYNVEEEADGQLHWDPL